MNFKNYTPAWFQDTRSRLNITLAANTIWNSAYAVLQLGLGLYFHSYWFYSLSGYYFSLAIMRFFLIQHSVKHKPTEKMKTEWRHYRTCGWIFLFTNLALTGMLFYMIYKNRQVYYHQIIVIAMATYTFTSLTIAIVNVIKYRKYNSPVFSASKIISLAAACISMLTLENSMLTTFGKETMTVKTKRLFLILSGSAVSIFIITMAVYMIFKANKTIKNKEYKNV